MIKRKLYNFTHYDSEYHIGYGYYDEDGRAINKSETATITDEELYLLLKPVLKLEEGK